jgi:hypothetical protein
MHPTRDTLPVIHLQLVGGRVMPSVMLLLGVSQLSHVINLH